MALKCQKKVAKNASMAKPPSTKMLHSYSYFLEWYEILTTKTRLICETFPKMFIGNGHYSMKKKQAAKVQCNPKMSGFWTLNCSQTFKTWIDMNFFLQ